MDVTVDFEQLTQELIRELRGEQSTRAVSMRLGFASNLVRRWESGDRAAPADEVLRLAHISGRNVVGTARRLNNAVITSIGDLTPRDDAFVPKLLASYAIVRSRADLSRRVGLSSHRLGRMIRGTTRIRFADLAKVMFSANRSLVEFVSGIADVTQIPSLEAACIKRDRIHSLYRDTPFIAMMLGLLTRDDYKALPAHDNAWVAKLMGLDVDAVRRAYARAEQLGLAVRNGAHLTENLHPLNLRLGLPQSLARSVAATFTREAADRIEQGLATTTWRVFSVREDTFGAMAHEMSLGLDAAARLGLENDGDRFGYAMMHLVSMDGRPIFVVPTEDEGAG